MELVIVQDVDGVAAEDALRGAHAYLQEHGYRAPDEAGQAWVRGGALGSLFAMAMDRLPTQLALQAASGAGGARLTLRYTVNDFGQFITTTNRRFWDIEAAELADQAAGREPDLARRLSYEAEARRDARRFVLMSAALAVGVSALIVGLARWSL